MFFRTPSKLDRLLAQQDLILRLLQTQGATLSAKLSTSFAALQAAIEKTTSVELASKSLIEGIAEKLRENAADPDAVQALADRLDAASASLAAAVLANTPAAVPEPTPPGDAVTSDAAAPTGAEDVSSQT